MIRSLSVDGYKALVDTRIAFNPGGLTVLLGPNASGKSTILEALDALSEIARNEMVSTRFSRAIRAEIAFHGQADRDITFAAAVPLPGDPASDLEWTVTIASGCIVREELSDPAWPKAQSRETFISPYKSACKAASDWTVEQGTPPGWREAALAVASEVGPVRIVRFEPAQLAQPANVGSGVAPDGLGLAAGLLDLLITRRQNFLDIQSRFRDLFPWVEEILLPLHTPTPSGPSSVSICFRERHRSKAIAAGHTSSGMLLALGLLWIVMRPEPERVVCYEEPENSMHPFLLRQVYDLLGKAARGELGGPPVQVVVATHSLDFVNLCKPEEIRVCERGADGTVRIHSIHDNKELSEALNAYRGALGELWYSGAIGGVPGKPESTGPR